MVLNAGVAEKVENLTMQLLEKIATPAITMDTASLMDECREIDVKLDSQEYLEEFRVNSFDHRDDRWIFSSSWKNLGNKNDQWTRTDRIDFDRQ